MKIHVYFEGTHEMTPAEVCALVEEEGLDRLQAVITQYIQDYLETLPAIEGNGDLHLTIRSPLFFDLPANGTNGNGSHG